MTLWVRSGTSSADPPVRKTRLRCPPRFFVAAVLIFLRDQSALRRGVRQRPVRPGPGSAAPRTASAGYRADALTGGALISADGAGHASYRLPDRTLALTFDDGPDPQWTPQVLQVLRRHRVPATFFVVGSQVARHRDLARRLVAEGNELGVHTFTHPVLGDLPAWRRRTEYAQTQMAIVHATGVHTRLLRLPYSSGPDSIDDINWPLVTEAGRLGYLSVFSDTDSRDWARPGVDAIMRNSTPADGRGAVVLLHDAGGDRSQTVRAWTG